MANLPRSSGGITYITNGDFAIQGMDANQAWLSILTVARELKLPVVVEFEWRDKDGAKHAGRRGRLSHV